VADDLGFFQKIALRQLQQLARAGEGEVVLADVRNGSFDGADFEVVALLQLDGFAAWRNVQPDFALAVEVEHRGQDSETGMVEIRLWLSRWTFGRLGDVKDKLLFLRTQAGITV